MDNLLKGGAAQAVQCFNIMHGFEEATRLTAIQIKSIIDEPTMKISPQTFVIKIGGELISRADIFNSLCKEIAKLKQADINIVVVHGGGQQANEMEHKTWKNANHCKW